MSAAMSLPIHILLVGGLLDRPGGIENYIILLMRYLDPNKISTHYLTTGRRPGRIRGAIWFRPIDYCLNQLNFAWTTLRLRPNLIVLNPSLFWSALVEPLGMLIFARLTRQKVIVVLHGWDEHLAEAMISRQWQGRLLVWFLRQAQHCMVLSDRFKEQLVAAGIPSDRVTVTSTMVEPALTKSNPNGRYPSQENVFRVLWLGRMLKVKGIWETLAAAETLHRDHPEAPFEFVLAGTGPELKNVQERVRALGLQEVVQLPGFVRDMQRIQLYRSADLFVLPSFHTEGFPTVILEASSVGLPLIYTPQGRLADLLTLENGLAIDVTALSGESLAEAIWELYQDPDRREAMSTANRELAQQYSVEIVCQQLENTYLKVTSGI